MSLRRICERAARSRRLRSHRRAQMRLRGRRWNVDGRSGITTDDIVRGVRRHRKDNDTSVALVDYVQFVKRRLGLSAHEALIEIVTMERTRARCDLVAGGADPLDGVRRLRDQGDEDLDRLRTLLAARPAFQRGCNPVKLQGAPQAPAAGVLPAAQRYDRTTGRVAEARANRIVSARELASSRPSSQGPARCRRHHFTRHPQLEPQRREDLAPSAHDRHRQRVAPARPGDPGLAQVDAGLGLAKLDHQTMRLRHDLGATALDHREARAGD